jgi:tRNA (guanine-N7-)-methyltransferase
MAQKKLLRFAQIKVFENVFEYPQNMKGMWHVHFKNKQPIILELACGRGEYTVSLAKLHPDKNFIGIDVKGNRMYIGAKQALDEGIINAAFLRTQIEKLPDYFLKDEVDEIWITFPDPQLRLSKAKKRLTHPRFLRLYQQVLKDEGCINLKTDSPDLYLFTKKTASMLGINIMEDLDDAYSNEKIAEELKIKTHYESLDIAGSKKIHYLRFQLPKVIADIDKQMQTEIEQDALTEQTI